MNLSNCKMNILILGSGGREHAITWKLSKAGRPVRIFVAPGNPGTAALAINVPVDIHDFAAVRDTILKNDIEMVIVGPEAPLVEGVRDFLEADPKLSGVAIIGPGRSGAMLEGSKDFAKAFMIRNGIPTARYKTFTAGMNAEAEMFLRSLPKPYVLKADGLAAGKGVLIIDDLDEAMTALSEVLSGRFGDAGNKVVIEEYLPGIELSVFVITDGKSYKLLPEAKDYKRIGEGDTGKNTGGMGAVSPVPFAGDEFMRKVEEQVIVPTIRGLQKEAIDYRGFIFFGLMNVGGDPYVIEYNARLGDPESEVILPRIESDLLDLFEGVAGQDLEKRRLIISEKTAATVMLVSGGYPEAYAKGQEIQGTDKVSDSILFHAGTCTNEGKLVNSGGRVIAVTSFGRDMEEALSLSYRSAGMISFDGMYYRRDIGFDLK